MKALFLTVLLSATFINANITQALEPTFSTITVSDPAKETEGYNKEYNIIFATMLKDMNAAPNTGNVNLDFVLEMIPHHEGGINMAKAIVKYGSNPEVKKIAKNIITSQEAQIPIMQGLKTRFEKEPLSNKKQSEEYLKTYTGVKDTMFKDMQNVEVTDNIDVNFLQEMIYHHEGAIGMAKNILKYTKDPQLKKLAENIVSTQSKGVSEMKALLKTL